MMEHINKEVLALKRISHGTLNLSGIAKGDYRPIKKTELKNLSIYLNKKINSLSKNEVKK